MYNVYEISSFNYVEKLWPIDFDLSVNWKVHVIEALIDLFYGGIPVY